MNSNVVNYMGRAYDCLRQANLLLIEQEYTGVVNRAYYAYFDAIRALLATLNINTRSHAAVQNLFSLHFVKENLFDRSDTKALAKLFDMRQNSDYEAEPDINEMDAVYAVNVATEFLLQTEAYLRDTGFTEPEML